MIRIILNGFYYLRLLAPNQLFQIILFKLLLLNQSELLQISSINLIYSNYFNLSTPSGQPVNLSINNTYQNKQLTHVFIQNKRLAYASDQNKWPTHQDKQSARATDQIK